MERRRRYRQAVADRVVRLVIACAVVGVVLVVAAAPALWALEQLGEAMAQAVD